MLGPRARRVPATIAGRGKVVEVSATAKTTVGGGQIETKDPTMTMGEVGVVRPRLTTILGLVGGQTRRVPATITGTVGRVRTRQTTTPGLVGGQTRRVLAMITGTVGRVRTRLRTIILGHSGPTRRLLATMPGVVGLDLISTTPATMIVGGGQGEIRGPTTTMVGAIGLVVRLTTTRGLRGSQLTTLGQGGLLMLTTLGPPATRLFNLW